MGRPSIECGDFGVALCLLPFGLDARLLEAACEVLLEGIDGPRITPKQAYRGGDITTFVSPGDRIIGDVEQGLKIPCEHNAQ
jgi:hypothetical protein